MKFNIKTKKEEEKEEEKEEDVEDEEGEEEEEKEEGEKDEDEGEKEEVDKSSHDISRSSELANDSAPGGFLCLPMPCTRSAVAISAQFSSTGYAKITVVESLFYKQMEIQL